jgi:hypothetical protein
VALLVISLLSRVEVEILRHVAHALELCLSVKVAVVVGCCSLVLAFSEHLLAQFLELFLFCLLVQLQFFVRGVE